MFKRLFLCLTFENKFVIIGVMFKLFKRIICVHKFAIEDMELTNIPELEKPEGRGYDEWSKYFSEYYEHDSITKRVKWPCDKCGKIFYAHCGLDITTNMFRRSDR